ncbi:MAG TPA: YihY/virulence factor BrkB family protein [Gemmatimonadales bacterium]|jgi:membrane protein
MATESRGVVQLLKDTINGFSEDDCPTMAAALSYYTVFSLPPLLVLLLTLLGAVMDPQDIQGNIEAQMRSAMGAAGAQQVHTILANVDRPGAGGLLPTVLSVIALLLGATGVFGQLQAALNKAWGVAPDPEKGGIKSMLLKRVFGIGMVLGLAFILLVSLVVSALLSAFGEQLGRFLPSGLSAPVLEAINFAGSLAVITLLFAAIFKVLPDATIAWSDVRVGALATALLFVAGKFALGLYLGHSNPGEAFGAAGALALMLVWIYYSSMIVLLGAELTQVWAENRGRGIEPEKGAVRVVREIRRLREV